MVLGEQVRKASKKPSEQLGAGANGLGKRIQDARLAQNLTLENVADEAGIDITTLCKIEGGHRKNPSFQTVARIAHGIYPDDDEAYADFLIDLVGASAAVSRRDREWANILGAGSFIECKKRVIAMMNAGMQQECKPYLRSLLSLAENDDDKGRAHGLAANLYKDLGRFGLAEKHYRDSLFYLHRSGDPERKTQTIILNMCEMWIQMPSLVLARQELTGVLQNKDLRPEETAFALHLYGKSWYEERSSHGYRRAIPYFRRAAALAGPEDQTRAAWSDMFRYAALMHVGRRRAFRIGLERLRQMAERTDPRKARNPMRNAELNTWIYVLLYEATRKGEYREKAIRRAQHYGFRSVLRRLEPKGSTDASACSEHRRPWRSDAARFLVTVLTAVAILMATVGPTVAVVVCDSLNSL